MKVGDKVTKLKVMKVDNPIGVIEKITKDYVVVVWDEIPGHWHYTHLQAEQLSLCNESR